MISPQSIRKGITIKFDNVVVDKPTIIKASDRCCLPSKELTEW